MLRRVFLSALLAFPILAFGQPVTAGRVEILTDLVKAIGEAGNAIASLTDGIKKLVIAGGDAYNYVAAERESNRLNDIIRRTGNLVEHQNVAVVNSLHKYLALKNPTDEDWSGVAKKVASTLSEVQALLNDVEKESGAFVNQDASLALKKTLAARTELLQEVAAMSPPFSHEERKLLAKVSSEYEALIVNAEAAVKELNGYVMTKK